MIYAGLLIVIAVVVYLMRKKKPAEQPKQEKPKLDESTATVSPTIKNCEKVTVVKDGVKTEGTVKILPSGLQIFDANGNEILSTQDLTKTIYGTVHTNGKSGAVNDERIKVGETFIFPYYSKIIPINNVDLYTAVDSGCSPVFSIKDGQITWKYYPAPKYGIEDVKFMYGGSI